MRLPLVHLCWESQPISVMACARGSPREAPVAFCLQFWGSRGTCKATAALPDAQKDPLCNTHISTQLCLGLVYGQMYKLAGKTGQGKKMTGWLLSEERAVTASLPQGFACRCEGCQPSLTAGDSCLALLAQLPTQLSQNIPPRAGHRRSHLSEWLGP